MKVKYFLLGLVSGIVLTFVVLIAIGVTKQNSEDPIQYFEEPLSYENKAESSFKVFQVLNEDAALASERSEERANLYIGNTVLIIGQDFYSDQIVNVKNPQRIGTYSYTTNGGMPKTVPVLTGEMN